MQSRILPVEQYIIAFDDALAALAIERRIDESTTDVVESYSFYAKNGARIGTIDYHGKIHLGEMNFYIEYAEEWQQWKDENYPHKALVEAIKTEISRALLAHKGKGLYQNSIFSRVKSDDYHMVPLEEEEELNAEKGQKP